MPPISPSLHDLAARRRICVCKLAAELDLGLLLAVPPGRDLARAPGGRPGGVYGRRDGDVRSGGDAAPHGRGDLAADPEARARVLRGAARRPPLAYLQRRARRDGGCVPPVHHLCHGPHCRLLALPGP